jgi:hypothetical protein
MLKERILNFLIIIFFGIMVIYLLNKPPTVIVKHPIIDKLTNVSYINFNEL